MKILSARAREKAVRYVRELSRPLERSLYAFHFEGASADAVVTALAEYRNPDGGFGNALEPDFRVPESSALATSVALEILEEIGAEENLPLLKGAVAWLADHFDRDRRVWRIIPAKTTPAPHAPWWDPEGLEETFGDFVVNPRAKIVGHLRRYSGEVFGTLIDDLVGELTAAVEEFPDENSVNTVLAVRDLAEADHLPVDMRKRLEAVLRRWIPWSVETAPSGWGEYCLKPINLADHPESPWRDLLGNSVDRNLDYEIDTQGDDGSWGPSWDWAGAFGEAWDIASREWSGILTLKNLRILTAYGRIEEGE